MHPIKTRPRLFLTTFDPSLEISEVILYQKVTFVKVKSREKVHCYNCQISGPIAQSCSILHRCLKCITSQSPLEYPRNTADYRNTATVVKLHSQLIIADAKPEKKAAKTSKNKQLSRVKQMMAHLPQSLTSPDAFYDQNDKKTIPITQLIPIPASTAFR